MRQGADHGEAERFQVLAAAQIGVQVMRQESQPQPDRQCQADANQRGVAIGQRRWHSYNDRVVEHGHAGGGAANLWEIGLIARLQHIDSRVGNGLQRRIVGIAEKKLANTARVVGSDSQLAEIDFRTDDLFDLMAEAVSLYPGGERVNGQLRSQPDVLVIALARRLGVGLLGGTVTQYGREAARRCAGAEQ